MKAQRLFALAWKSLWLHRLRSLLTVLGMPMAILLCGLILIRIRRQA